MAWLLFAFGSAIFAGITAVLAKIGIQKVNSTLATALRTIVVFGIFLADGFSRRLPGANWADFTQDSVLSDFIGLIHRRLLAVLFPRPAIGRCQ